MNQAVITHRGVVGPAEPAPAEDAIPADLLTQRDRTVRYARGGTVYATDGRIGVLKHVVVDEHGGEVAEICVETDEGEVVVPVDLVDRTAGTAVFLVTSRVQFGERASEAERFDRKRFSPANLKALLSAASGHGQQVPRRVAIAAGKDYVETPAGSLLDRL